MYAPALQNVQELEPITDHEFKEQLEQLEAPPEAYMFSPQLMQALAPPPE